MRTDFNKLRKLIAGGSLRGKGVQDGLFYLKGIVRVQQQAILAQRKNRKCNRVAA